MYRQVSIYQPTNKFLFNLTQVSYQLSHSQPSGYEYIN